MNAFVEGMFIALKSPKIWAYPLQFFWAYLKRGKLFSAFHVLFVMSHYSFIPFVVIGILTKWWIGVVSFIAWFIFWSFYNYKCLENHIYQYDIPEKALEYAEKIGDAMDEDGTLHPDKYVGMLLNLKDSEPAKN